MAKSSMRRCPQCTTTYPAPEQFCKNDGSPLSDIVLEPEPTDGWEGKVIGDRFVLKKCLGSGGMGVVYLATHRVLERYYAIKLMRREFISDERALQRFRREAKAVSAVDHPNIISIYDYGRTNQGEPYLAMEYVEGISLYDAVAESKSSGLSLNRTIDIAIQIARALAHAHERGIVHRDIKPENILLTLRDGIPDWVKVLDFGVARIVGQPPLTRMGDGAIGTPHFMAPEMLEEGTVGAPVDLYALGILIHDILIGSPPFSGELNEIIFKHLNTVPPLLSARAPNLAIPADLNRLCARLLDKDPARRPTSREAVTLLEQMRAALPQRSLRSLLIAKTVVQADTGKETPVATAMLSSDQRSTTIKSPGAIPTVILPQLLQEVDQLDEEMKQASSFLSSEVEMLGSKLWPAGWPTEAATIQKHIHEREEAEQDLGLRLALLQDQVEEHRQIEQQRREAIRHQIIELSERLRFDHGLGTRELEVITLSLAERERAFVAAQEAIATTALTELDQVRQQMQDLRSEQDRSQVQLTRQVLSAPCPSVLQADRRCIEERLGQFESAAFTLAQHLSSIQPGPERPT